MSSIPQRLDKYELVERLGHGGVAEVWKAFDTQLQRYVAIKLLHPNLRDDPNFIVRFQREAQLIASLHHPNIVQIHDFQVYHPSEGDPTPIAYMVMDYVEGQTLAEYIRDTSSKGNIPSPTEIVNLFTSISLAIDYAHQKGMIHRDIKPANILLDKRNTVRNPMGEPILTDFGVAKLMSAPSMTQSGAQLGTPLYISPEQARGYPGNERSDLYSLGVILYEIVTGVMPFRGDTAIDVISQHINVMPTAPTLINPKIPPALAMVIMRSIAKDPAARFPSASAMTVAIAEAVNVPVPEVLGQAASSQDPMNAPTTFASLSMGLPVSASLGMSPAPASVPTPMAANAATPVPTPAPAQSMSAPIPPTQPVQWSNASVPPTAPVPPAAGKGKRSGLLIVLVAGLIVVLLGAGVGAVLFLPKSLPTFFAQQSPIVGRAFYTSSGQLNTGTAQGIADQMKIDLQNIPNPQPGKSYYVWLLPDQHPDTQPDLTGPRPIQPPILLTNNLPVQNGTVNYTFSGDAQHNNLLSTTSRLLITEEPANRTPSTYSTDHSTWRYFAAIPQSPIPGDTANFSALVHIRHLFYNETDIKVLGLPGGLDIWLFRNTEKILEWSVSARDDWNGPNTSDTNISLMKAQFIRILDYLDGTPNVHVDLPAGTPVLADPAAARVALLTVDTKNQGGANLATNPPGYIDHVQLHVGQVAKATDITPEMRQNSAQIIEATKNAGTWLFKVHDDAAQLFKLGADPAQLRQSNAGVLLDDLVTQATYAYIGQLDPVTNQVHPGVIQVHYDVQQLATLVITKNVPQSL